MKNSDKQAILIQIAAEHGGVLRPADVVNAARPEDHPLHKYFEWNDKKAGEAYRRQQARQLITQVRVNVRDGKPIQAWVNIIADRNTDNEGYHGIVEVLSDEERLQQLKETAAKELEYFERKYSRIEELADVFAAAHRFQRGLKH